MRKIGNSDFSTKPTNYYNLDVIISVGYRVKSQYRPRRGHTLVENNMAHKTSTTPKGVEHAFCNIAKSVEVRPFRGRGGVGVFLWLPRFDLFEVSSFYG